MLLTDCNNTTFKKQKPYFRNVKTPFLQTKKVVFVDPKVWFVVMNLGYSMVFSPFLNFILLQKCCVLNRRI